MTTGEGGVIMTDNEELSKEAYRMKNHGRLEKGVFIHEKIGFNFSFTEMQAAIGIAQLRKLDKIIKRKNEIRNFYMKNLPNVKFSYVDPKCSPVHWFTSIWVKDIDDFVIKMKEKGIQTRRFFYPINRQPCYKDFKFKGEYPATEEAYKHWISLPSSALLKDEQINFICKTIKEILK